MKKKQKKEISWSYLIKTIFCVLCGLIMIIQGIDAYMSGRKIPLRGRDGVMSGLQSITAGALFLLFGIAFVIQGKRKASHNRSSRD